MPPAPGPHEPSDRNPPGAAPTDSDRSEGMRDADVANGEGNPGDLDEDAAGRADPTGDSPGATIDSDHPAEPNEPA